MSNVAQILLVFVTAIAALTSPLWGGWFWWSWRRRRRVFLALKPAGATKVRGALVGFSLVGHVARVHGINPWHIEVDDVLPAQARLLVAHDYGPHHKGAVGGGALVGDLPLTLTKRSVDIISGFAVWSADLDTARGVLRPQVIAALTRIARLQTASTKDGTLRLVIGRASLLGSPERELPEVLAMVDALVFALQPTASSARRGDVVTASSL